MYLNFTDCLNLFDQSYFSHGLQEMRWSSRRIQSFFTIGAVLWVFSGAGIFILASTLQYFMYALSVNGRLGAKKCRRRVIFNYVFCYLIITVYPKWSNLILHVDQNTLHNSLCWFSRNWRWFFRVRYMRYTYE
jgi:hypothetical protein